MVQEGRSGSLSDFISQHPDSQHPDQVLNLWKHDVFLVAQHGDVQAVQRALKESVEEFSTQEITLLNAYLAVMEGLKIAASRIDLVPNQRQPHK